MQRSRTKSSPVPAGLAGGMLDMLKGIVPSYATEKKRKKERDQKRRRKRKIAKTSKRRNRRK